MKKKILIVVLGIIFLAGLVYLVVPGPTSITDFPPLPNSTKSDYAGDTWQNPQNAGYFSQYRRADIVSFYKSALKNLLPFGKFLPPLRLNRPPEEAYTYVRMYEQSTFLEQYTYPLRESIFVNGYDPLEQNGGVFKDLNTDYYFYKGWYYATKTTLHFATSKVQYRVLVYLGIWVSVVFLWKVGVKAKREQFV